MHDLISRIEAEISAKIIRQQTVGGGCIAQTDVITDENGRNYFLKQGLKGDNFKKEANSLNELERCGVFRTPKVLGIGTDYLLLENISPGTKPISFFESFGAKFAKLHRYTAPEFGFFENNYIGSNPQINICDNSDCNNWPQFYFNKRLLYQFRLCEHNAYADDAFTKAFVKLESKIETILDCNPEPPALLHGDLWGGNYMVDKMGNPVLIDPAVYYGNREADLAMTKLFGGFEANFYRSYHKTYPLQEGYEYRENIYILYHVLNHLNIFGISYKNQALQLINSYL